MKKFLVALFLVGSVATGAAIAANAADCCNSGSPCCATGNACCE